MYIELQSIKEQLFDAPVEVKQAFNTLVNYFDFGKGKFGKHKKSPSNWIVYEWEMKGGSGKGTTWEPEKVIDTIAVHTDDKKAAEDQVRYRVEIEKGGRFIKVHRFFVGEGALEKADQLTKKLNSKSK